MKKRTVASLFTIAAFLLSPIGCKNDSPEPGRSTWTKLRIGYLPVAAELPLFVAVERGFFKQLGIEVELVSLASSNEMGNAATADRIDILAGAATNVILDIGHVSGKKHQLFAINPYSSTPGHVTDHLIARKDSGIRQISDLKGKTVASFPGSVTILVQLVLEKHGLVRSEYQLRELLPANWEPSLQSGSIDAVVALEPTATQIIADAVGIPILSGFYAELLPDMPLSGHWVSADFLTRANQAQLAAFLKAYDLAIAYCRDHEPEAKSALPRYAGVREDIVTLVNLNPWKQYSEIDIDHLQAYIDLLAANNAILSRANASEYVLRIPGR